jgi:hypothetical protein
MRRVTLTLQSGDKSVEYIIDLSTNTFNSTVTDASGDRTTIQTGMVGQSDVEKQDLALRLYHIMLAALRASDNEGS